MVLLERPILAVRSDERGRELKTPESSSLRDSCEPVKQIETHGGDCAMSVAWVVVGVPTMQLASPGDEWNHELHRQCALYLSNILLL